MKSIIFSAICILILAGCGDNGSEPDNSKKEIWPLAVGNSWTIVYYTTRDLKNDTTTHNHFSTYYVTQTLNLEGEIWYQLASNGNNSENILTNREDGIYGINNKNQVEGDTLYHLEKARLGYKYPVILHESYPDEINGMFIASTNAQVKTKTGTFSCIKYVPSNYKNVENYGIYLCPGIGLIKSIGITHIDTTKTIPDTVWTVEELVSYTIR